MDKQILVENGPLVTKFLVTKGYLPRWQKLKTWVLFMFVFTVCSMKWRFSCLGADTCLQICMEWQCGQARRHLTRVETSPAPTYRSGVQRTHPSHAMHCQETLSLLCNLSTLLGRTTPRTSISWPTVACIELFGQVGAISRVLESLQRRGTRCPTQVHSLQWPAIYYKSWGEDGGSPVCWVIFWFSILGFLW